MERDYILLSSLHEEEKEERSGTGKCPSDMTALDQKALQMCKART
jgi:hypothetical protein